MRRCLASGRVLPRKALLRLAVAPDGALVPDVAGELPGRGLWITPARDLIERARKKNLFARAAKAPVKVSGDLEAKAEALMLRRSLECLGLARRAGQLVSGFEKVKASIKADKAAIIVQASDGAPEGKRKLRDLAAARAGIPSLENLFSKAELGAIVGREDAVHIAVASGGLADRFLAEAARLQSLRGLSAPSDEAAGNPGSINPDRGSSGSAQLRKVSE